ncbi:MAG: geranylgeranylglyceryl/heptaprenylglyceryl phosphate synthase [Candidatus Micrarchaeota archaeon]|nr:geranylgeranylglyceryl/heptaprenylglyceryl phosphate synthase [Candidatus Micrarchaeota archaeon]
MANVKDYLFERLEKKGAALAALIDPLDHPSAEKAVLAAKEAFEAGADYILVGGSIGVGGVLLDEICKEIKQEVSCPLVLFPGNISTISKFADAIYFMSLLNSTNPYWITQAQMLAIPLIERYKLETLAVGYIVIEPGGTVGWVGEAKLIPRSKPFLAASLAKVAELFGMDFALVDSGSNPIDGPVSAEFVRAIKSFCSIPIIVAGGIRTAQQAKDLVRAGASILQVGTILEKNKDVKKSISAISKAIEEGVKSRSNI